MNRLSVLLALGQMVWRVILNVDRDIIHPLAVKWRDAVAKKKADVAAGGPGPCAGLGVGPGLAAGFFLLLCLFCGSCAYLKSGVVLVDGWFHALPESTNVTSVVTNAPASTNVPVVVSYIPGDVRDKGADMAMLGFGGFADVRYSANDVQNLHRQVPSIQCQGSWYPLDPGVVTGLSLQIQRDGSIVCQATDFTSARTGLRYRFCGYLIQVSTGTLVTANPYTIPAADCAKTLRIMYATVAK